MDGCDAQSLNGSKPPQQGLFAGITNARKFIQNALADLLQSQLGIVGVGKPMGFITDSLEELDRSAVQPGPQRIFFARQMNLFELLGQAQDRYM